MEYSTLPHPARRLQLVGDKTTKPYGLAGESA